MGSWISRKQAPAQYPRKEMGKFFSRETDLIEKTYVFGLGVFSSGRSDPDPHHPIEWPVVDECYPGT